MKRQTNLTVMATTVLVAMAGHAMAQTPVLESRDRITGAFVRIYRTETGPRLELDAPAVSLTKQLSAGRVIVTTLRDGKESLRIEVSETGMLVQGTGGQVRAAAGDEAAAERARALVAKSSLTKKAATLIGKMGFGTNSSIAPLLLTTRAFLLAASKDQSGVRDLMKWMRSQAQPKAIPVALPIGAQKSSSQCYSEYSDEILAAYDDFVDCTKNIKWYDPFFPIERCEVVYESRILAAFAGWMHCLGVTDVIRN